MNQPSILNISCYKFVTIYDTKVLKDRYKSFCGALGVKGSIVFSLEGINIMLAGTKEQINQFANFLHSDSRFADIVFKESHSYLNPFNNMVTKSKAHIVPADAEINPIKYTVPNIKPVDLKKWLDESRDFTLVDTRNDYELEIGSFDKAIDFNLTKFSDIYDSLKAMPQAVKDKPLVMFCTGGIRCEKGGPIAIQAGFKEVYQLEGGILNYFEECGSKHYHGDCFVFDQRVAVGAALTE